VAKANSWKSSGETNRRLSRMNALPVQRNRFVTEGERVVKRKKKHKLFAGRVIRINSPEPREQGAYVRVGIPRGGRQ